MFVNKPFRSKKAFNKLFSLNYDFKTVWDVGCGEYFIHTNAFEERGKKVTSIDIFDEADIKGIFPNIPNIEKLPKPDLIWCSHCLEHQENVGLFLGKIFSCLKDDGILAITVHVRKDEIVGGHVTLWNMGLLFYNLILAGFDCSKASGIMDGYDISVIVKKKEIKDFDYLKNRYLRFSKGDIEILNDYFPIEAKQNFNGFIKEVNW